MRARLSKMQIWGMPTAIGVVSAVGLVTALLADGMGDVISWCALSVPTGVSIWFGVWSKRTD